MPSLAQAIERAYVAAAMHAPFTLDLELARALPPEPDVRAMMATAAAGAVASRYLAVGTPRSIGLVGNAAACSVSLAAHRAWFAPRDIRWVAHEGAFSGEAPRLVSLDEALAADIVCVHAPTSIAAGQLRRGTHVNALAPVELDAQLVAVIARELAPMAAGLVDGRQLDEITIYTAGDVAIAITAAS